MSPLVIADLAEHRSRIPQLMRASGATVDERRLGEGDYLLSAAFAVERKAGPDLVRSLLDGRLIDQLDRLSRTYEYGALLIEGDSWAHDRRLKTPILARAYQWISLRPNLTVIYSPHPRYSARLLAGIARAEQNERHALPPTPHPPVATAPDPQRLLHALPGVGPAGAAKLSARFQSLRELALSDRDELTAAIGPTRGPRLHAFLDARL